MYDNLEKEMITLSKADKERLTIECPDCGTNFTISYGQYRRPNRIFRCVECRKVHVAQRRKVYLENLTPEQRQTKNAKISANSKKYQGSLLPEVRIARAKNMAAAKKVKLDTDPEYRQQYSQVRKDYYANLPEEEKEKNRERSREYYDSLSDEGKKEYADIRCGYYASLSPDEQKKFIADRQWWDKLSEEDRKKYSEINSKSSRSYWDNITDEERSEISARQLKIWEDTSDDTKAHVMECLQAGYREYLDNMTPEQRQEINAQISDRVKTRWASYSVEKYEQLASELRQRNPWVYGTPEQKEILSAQASARSIKRWESLSKEEQTAHIDKMIAGNITWWNSIVEDKGEAYDEFIRKTRSKAIVRKSSLHEKFEKRFQESMLINNFYYRSEECFISEGIVHNWDYSIYGTDDRLVALVDLDGIYYHADGKHDYDGNHSTELNDDRRFQTVPDGVIYHIIHQDGPTFESGFAKLIKLVWDGYDKFVEDQFKICRATPFPVPRYTAKQLQYSYSSLLKIPDKNPTYFNVHTQDKTGNNIIYHFHPSIYEAHCKGSKMSPFEAWHDDTTLRMCIENRVIYANNLNPNKILSGFNISRIAKKVSVFSAGRAVHLINHYLGDCSEVFDPFSGFSGRMLGAVSLGKKYIGQDISPIHVLESNRIIDHFGWHDRASISVANCLTSTGTYQCLFTCPPYGDKERWLDVPVDTRSCDDWIDVCLTNFNCQKYLFVVDNTSKYNDYIQQNITDLDVDRDEISGKIDQYRSNELVILVERAR